MERVTEKFRQELSVIEMRAKLLKLYRSLPEHNRRKFDRIHPSLVGIRVDNLTHAIYLCKKVIQTYKDVLNFDSEYSYYVRRTSIE